LAKSYWSLFQIPQSNTFSFSFNSRSKYKCLHVISPERNKAILTWIIQNIVDSKYCRFVKIQHTVCVKSIKRAQYKNKFWPPPSFKKTSWSLHYFPGITTSLHTYRQTDTEDTNRKLDWPYITRPKRLGTSTRRQAILHVKNSVLPSAANMCILHSHLLHTFICVKVWSTLHILIKV
jgi:hypothetical protein